jgi:hypothetical protein
MTAIRFDLISETIDCAGASEAKDRSELTAVSELILHRLAIRSVDGYKTPQSFVQQSLSNTPGQAVSHSSKSDDFIIVRHDY